jgi:NHLM bacteriocin system ABC transporter ATP-binding protein
MSVPVEFGDDVAPAETQISGARVLHLERERAWLVRSGRIDVFATELVDEQATGPRTHLFRVEAGGPLIGCAAVGGLALIGVGAPGTTVIEPEHRYWTGHDPERDDQSAIGHVNAWIGYLYQALSFDVRSPRHKLIEPGSDLEVDPGVCIKTTAAIGWLEHVSGSSLLLGQSGGAISSGSVLPITRESWIRTVEFSHFRLRTTAEEVARHGDRGFHHLWSAVTRLQSIVLQMIVEQQRVAEAANRERARRQQEAKQATMRGVITRLAATIDHGKADNALMRDQPRSDEREEHSLFPAFRLVANALGITVGEARKAHEQAQPKDPIQAIARAYRVRTRRVALRGEWWKTDSGPLLARIADRARAVALLPLAKGGYEMVDPFANTRVPVDAEAAASLGAFAYSIYRPFEATGLTPRALLRFALFGCGRDVGTVIAIAGAVAVLGMVPPIVVSTLYNAVIPGADRGQLLQLSVALIVTALATATFQFVRGFAMLRIEATAGPRLQAAVWDRLLTLPLPFFRDYAAGDLAVRAMGIEDIRNIVSGTLVSVLLSGIFSLANFILLFKYAPSLAWVAALLIFVAMATAISISLLQLRSQRAIMRVQSRTSGVVLQLLSGVPKLKVAAAEPQAFGVWARLFGTQREQQFRARVLGNAQAAFTAVFPLIATLVLFAAVAPHLKGNQTDGVPPIATGDFLGFITAFNGALGAMLASATAVVASLSVIPLYEQINPILQTEPEVFEGKQDPGELSGHLELQKVTFRYAADGPHVLRDLSISVQPGEFVAFVGPSGSGKSTTLRLLLGFEHPESGTISYDEQDLSALDLESVRRQIGVVMQSGKLSAGDIFSNIVGSSSSTIDEAWEAARMAGMEEDIREMPMGMHTVVSDGGGGLSGGQRQRLMIARALVHRPRIIYFDEATSALDNRTQSIVSKSLDRLKVTRVVVAHRLSTVRNADRIFVIDKGTVVESGAFEQLYAMGGVFTQLAKRQLV